MFRLFLVFVAVFCVLQFTPAGDLLLAAVHGSPTQAVVPTEVVSPRPSAAPSLQLNPDVTLTTMRETICTAGYTRLVRPATSYTNGLKLKLLRERDEPADNARLYELDHVIPLSLGGHPRAVENLRLQPWPEAHKKDRLEVLLQCLVCSGQVDLDEARQEMATSWEAAYDRYIGQHCRRNGSHEERADAR